MPAVPKGARRPADHAVKAEAKSGNVEFDYDGEHYTIDRANADNVEILEFVEDEKYISAIRGYLGVDQWAKFKDTHRDEQGRVPSAHFEPFLQYCMDELGGPKNSSASAGS